MPSTTTYSRGDIVLVPFPYTDLSASGQRPVVIVSTNAYVEATADLIVAQITSQVDKPHYGDHRVESWQQAGLRRPSVVRAKVATIHRALVVKRLGHMPAADLRGVEDGLRQALAL